MYERSYLHNLIISLAVHIVHTLLVREPIAVAVAVAGVFYLLFVVYAISAQVCLFRRATDATDGEK